MSEYEKGYQAARKYLESNGCGRYPICPHNEDTCKRCEWQEGYAAFEDKYFDA